MAADSSATLPTTETDSKKCKECGRNFTGAADTCKCNEEEELPMPWGR